MNNQVANIKAELVRREVTQTQIARMLKVSPAAVNAVISGTRKNPRIRKAISLTIGKPVDELWPDQAERKDCEATVS